MEESIRLQSVYLYNFDDATQLFDKYVMYPEVNNGTQPSRFKNVTDI